MAERKAVRPLRVALTPGTEDLAKVKSELIDKGHEVTILPGLEDYDLVLGANAHRMGTFNEKLLALTIKACRLRVYGEKGGKRVGEKEA